MAGNFQVDQLGAKGPEPVKRPFLIRFYQPGIARHIGGHDRRETAGLTHPSGIPALRSPST